MNETVATNETTASEKLPIPEEVLDGRFLFGLSDLSRDTLPDGFPQNIGFEQALFAWAEKKVPGNQLDLFHSLFSVDSLKKAFEEGHTSRSFEYDDLEDESLSHRLVLHMLSDEETGNLLCVSSVKSFPRLSSDSSLGKGAMDSPFLAIIRSYRLFFCVDPNQPQIRKSSVFRDLDGLTAEAALPCSYHAFLKKVSGKYVRSAWEDDFLQAASMENLSSLITKGQFRLRFPFSSEHEPMQLEVFLPGPGNEDRQYYFAVSNIEEGPENNSIISSGDREAMHATIEDLHLTMQMERDETRKIHRRHCILLVLITAVLCILGGAVLEQKLPAFSSLMSRFLPVRTEEPAPAEIPEVIDTEVPVLETVVSYVPFTKAAEFQADLLENGLPRENASNETYEPIPFSVTVEELLTPDWFKDQYAKKNYNLDGTESGIRLSLSFTGTENKSSVIPQDSFPVRIVDAQNNILTSYQLMDQPMGGAYNVTVAAGESKDLYKRYEPQNDPCYLILTYYQDTVPHDLYFSLRYDDPNVDYEELKLGDKGELVRAMNQKLASLGFLNEKSSNNSIFTREIALAVSSAREDFGMEKSEVADSTFLKTLFSK